MNTDLTDRVKFDLLRYANCWEDVEILLEGLSPQEGSKILSVGSAGDNSFSLLVTNPELVVAVDISKIQLYLIELKKASIQNLSREETIGFLGFRGSEMRLKVFEKIKKDLSLDARIYWNANLPLVQAGIIHQGKFEKYFQLFSQKVLPWIHPQKTVAALLSKKTKEEQYTFYHDHWNTWRWKLLFRIFFSRFLMGRLGRDPEFLKQVKGSVSDFIYSKAEKHLITLEAQNNYILRYNLTRNFGELLPHYLQEAHYDIIKSNIDRLVLKEGFAQNAVDDFGKFDYKNLSDIFEYMDKEQFASMAKKLIEGTEKGGKIAYWNLMVPRRISTIFPTETKYMQEISEKLTSADKGFFYKQFIVDKIEA